MGIYKIRKAETSGVAKGRGTWVHAPRRSWNFFSEYNRTLNSTRFVTIYGFVQSNIQHVSPVTGGFAPDPHKGSAPGPRWGTSVLRPRLSSLSKFLATPLTETEENDQKVQNSYCQTKVVTPSSENDHN